MDTATSKAGDEAQIRQVIEDWVQALRSRDVSKMMSNYTTDVLVFGATPPLQYAGAEAYRQKWQEMFDSIDGPIGHELRDLTITARGDIAFSHCLSRMRAKTKDGHGNLPWVRITLCFRKIDGKWLVTHEHASVPFDTASGRASLDLKP